MHKSCCLLVNPNNTDYYLDASSKGDVVKINWFKETPRKLWAARHPFIETYHQVKIAEYPTSQTERGGRLYLAF